MEHKGIITIGSSIRMLVVKEHGDRLYLFAFSAQIYRLSRILTKSQCLK